MGKKSDPTQLEIELEYAFEHGFDMKHRIIYITGEIERGAFASFDAAITRLEKASRAAIRIRINTEGGDVYEALAIVGRMLASKNQIITEGYGQICSAGIYLIAAGDKRSASKYCTFMYHEMSYSINENHERNKDNVDQAEIEHCRVCKMLEDFTNKEWTYWKVCAKNKDMYFETDRAIELGVIDASF